MNEGFLMVALRLLHILGGIFWVGSVALVAWFLLPTVASLGEAGGRLMPELMLKHKLRVYLSAAMVVTVLSGIVMYWRLTSVTHGAWAGSRTGIVIGIGALAAVIGGAVGSAVGGASNRKLASIRQTIQDTGGPPSAAQKLEMAGLQARGAWGLRVSAMFLLFAAAAMAVARYV